jgi:hypothetical protein
MLKQINLIRVALALVIILVASIYIPDLYWKASKSEINRTSVFYSPIKKGFILTKSDVRGSVYTDIKGKTLTRDEFEEATPFMNFRQLMISGKLPDSIDHVAIVPKALNLNNIVTRVTPGGINSRPVQLFPLIESASGRARLELPPDYFRITKRMEFITSMTNEINEEKTQLYTNALLKEGFTFPSKGIYGNPTTKKPFDEGYFVIDNANKVFHIKMVKGQPFCKNTGISSDLGIVLISTAEYELREFYGLLVTEKNEVYFISYNNYKLIKLTLDDYNHQEDVLQIKCDLFYRVLVINKENGLNSVVLDRDYKVVDRYSEKWPTKEIKTSGIIASYLFPFSVSIEKNTTPFINFYFSFSDWRCLILSVILLVVTFFYFKKKNISLKKAGVYYVLVLLTGLYGFIAVLVIKDFDNDPGTK